MALDISSEECLDVNDASFIVWNSTRNLEDINVSSMNLCESGQLIQSVEVLVTVPTQLLRILRTCAYSSVSLCCAQFPLALVTCTDDPHRLKRAIKNQVRSQLNSLSIHAVASLNKSLTFQCHRIQEHSIIGSHRNEIAHGGGAVIQ